MPADFSEYVNLTIFDKEPGDIYRDSIELARLSLPEFNLRTGSPEDAIFQAMAYVSALNIAAINRLPNRLMAGIVGMLGFIRQEAIPAEIDVTITLNTYDGGTIPAGTVFSYEALFEDELQEFPFQTTSALELEPTDLEISVDYPSASATIVCLTPGIIPPIDDGSQFKILSSGTQIQTVIVRTPSNFANGINADSDTDYLSRATNYLRSLTSSLTRATQVDSYVLSEYPDVISRVKTYDLTNGDDTSGDITVKRQAGVIKTFLDNNLATIQTAAPHLFITGDTIELEVFDPSVSATFNGLHEITATGSDTVNFVKVATNSASTTVTASAYAGQDVSGFVTVFGYGLNTYLTSIEKTNVVADIRAKSVAGLTFEMLDPEICTLEISGEVVISESYDAASVEGAVLNALVDFISPAKYPYTQDRVRQTQLISLISNVPGVVFVESLTLIPTGSGWLPQLGNDLLFHKKGSLPIIAVEDIDLTFTVLEIS